MIFLYSHPSVQAEYLSSLRIVNCGAAPLGALDEEKFRKKVGRPLNILQGKDIKINKNKIISVLTL